MLTNLFPWITSFPWFITFAAVIFGAQTVGQGEGKFIKCDCTTAQCNRQGVSACTTEGLCFVQYLDRRGKLDVGSRSPILVRGCTEGRTPLLCENRKPSRVKKWPVLHCCGTDFCNRNAVPTPPAPQEDIQLNFKTIQQINQNVDPRNSSFSDVALSSMTLQASPTTREESSHSSLLSLQQSHSWPHIVGPVYVSVLVLGIVSLVIIGIVAATVIRKSNRFYTEHHCRTLQFRRGKTETHVMHCDCDSEIESVDSSRSNLHIGHPSRMT